MAKCIHFLSKRLIRRKVCPLSNVLFFNVSDFEISVIDMKYLQLIIQSGPPKVYFFSLFVITFFPLLDSLHFTGSSRRGLYDNQNCYIRGTKCDTFVGPYCTYVHKY